MIAVGGDHIHPLAGGNGGRLDPLAPRLGLIGMTAEFLLDGPATLIDLFNESPMLLPAPVGFRKLFLPDDDEAVSFLAGGTQDHIQPFYFLQPLGGAFFF